MWRKRRKREESRSEESKHFGASRRRRRLSTFSSTSETEKKTHSSPPLPNEKHPTHNKQSGVWDLLYGNLDEASVAEHGGGSGGGGGFSASGKNHALADPSRYPYSAVGALFAYRENDPLPGKPARSPSGALGAAAGFARRSARLPLGRAQRRRRRRRGGGRGARPGLHRRARLPPPRPHRGLVRLAPLLRPDLDPAAAGPRRRAGPPSGLASPRGATSSSSRTSTGSAPGRGDAGLRARVPRSGATGSTPSSPRPPPPARASSARAWLGLGLGRERLLGRLSPLRHQRGTAAASTVASLRGSLVDANWALLTLEEDAPGAPGSSRWGRSPRRRRLRRGSPGRGRQEEEQASASASGGAAARSGRQPFSGRLRWPRRDGREHPHVLQLPSARRGRRSGEQLRSAAAEKGGAQRQGQQGKATATKTPRSLVFLFLLFLRFLFPGPRRGLLNVHGHARRAAVADPPLEAGEDRRPRRGVPSPALEEARSSSMLRRRKAAATPPSRSRALRRQPHRPLHPRRPGRLARLLARLPRARRDRRGQPPPRRGARALSF